MRQRGGDVSRLSRRREGEGDGQKEGRGVVGGDAAEIREAVQRFGVPKPKPKHKHKDQDPAQTQQRGAGQRWARTERRDAPPIPATASTPVLVCPSCASLSPAVPRRTHPALPIYPVHYLHQALQPWPPVSHRPPWPLSPPPPLLLRWARCCCCGSMPMPMP